MSQVNISDAVRYIGCDDHEIDLRASIRCPMGYPTTLI